MNPDPHELAEELAAELHAAFPDTDAFDIQCAVYWYAAQNHGGQWTPLYGVLSLSEYRPGILETGPEPDSMASMMLEHLESNL